MKHPVADDVQLGSAFDDGGTAHSCYTAGASVQQDSELRNSCAGYVEGHAGSLQHVPEGHAGRLHTILDDDYREE